MLQPAHRYALIAFFLAFFLLAFFGRSLAVYKKTGINPFVLRTGDDIHGYVGRAFGFVILGCTTAAAFIAFHPNPYPWLGWLTWAQSPTSLWIGWAIALVSFLWVLIAQSQMGASWRIGIDKQHHTGLIQHGLFALSRNPIFLAMRCVLLGLVLIFPAAATVTLGIAGEILMQVQVRLEEQHLLSQHGDAYTDYCTRVRRWL